ncbi:hypothetical protein HY522_00535, partial [bacterium]|nr:hypothetical protein [bacterium]
NATGSVVQIYEDLGVTDIEDTNLVLDNLYIEVHDTDDNRNPQISETVTVTVYVGDHNAGLVIDTESLDLTETADTSAVFRSDTVIVTDTLVPKAEDGIISWGRSDTIHVAYQDPNQASDSSFDTALAVEIATAGQIILYEDEARTDPVDTFLTRDLLYVAVHDTDQNINPQTRDTVTVVIYVGNGSREGSDEKGLVLDTQTLVLTESGETTGIFVCDTVTLTDTEVPSTENGRISWGRSDTLHVVYTDPTGAAETRDDTALAVEIPTVHQLTLYEDAGFGDAVDTFQTRDVMYVEVVDTDENRNPQLRDTVSVTVYVGNGEQEGITARGLVLDTETLILTEGGETGGFFRTAAVILTDTEVPVTQNGVVSWGRSDTLHVAYADLTGGISDSGSDTALAVEIPSAAWVQLYENSAFTDEVDTYLVLDKLHIQVTDTDENRNPQFRDTVSVTVYVGNGPDRDPLGLVIDTDILILTEAGETSGVFRSDTIELSNVLPLNVNDGRVTWGEADTIHVAYDDVTGSAESTFDTALAIGIATPGNVYIYEDNGFTNITDTLLTRDLVFIEVQDTDENQNPQIAETFIVTVYIGNGVAEGASAAGLVIDTELLTLTESADTSGVFRSADTIVVTDTVFPKVGDGILSWGRFDTLHVAYIDPTDPTDSAFDTALALEIATGARAVIYEDAGFTDDVDTLLTRDLMYVAVHDTDENRHPELRDTVSATVYVGNGVGEGSSAAGLVIDTEIVILTESGETTGVFQSGAIVVTDTERPLIENGRL